MKNTKSIIAAFTKSAVITLLPVFLLLVIPSCKEKEPTDPEGIRQKITTYNQEIVELNQKVSDLEKQLEAMGETTHNRERTLVEVTNMAYEPFDNMFKVNAEVEAVKEATISPEINGHIQSINVIKGEKVRAGQVLARLNTSVIENNIAEIKTSLELAETVYNRQKRLWEQEIGSEIQYLQAKNQYESMQTRLKTAESQLAKAFIKAPISGVVDDIYVKEGELAMPGVPLMMIINLNQLFINADISETFLPMINSDDNVILRFPVYPDYEEEVPIHRIGNVINPENRTFRLQLKINNRDEMIKPNMIATLAIRTFRAEEALVVPSIIIKQDTQGYYLYVARENDEGELVARKVYIERGMSGEGITMITSGLEAGDKLITQGHNRVVDGTFVTVSDEDSISQAN